MAENWVVQSIIGINQGTLGVVPWDDPTTPDIKSSASALAMSLLPDITPCLFNPASVHTTYVGGASVATRKARIQTLVLATNTMT